jgi:hypothetical protein
MIKKKNDFFVAVCSTLSLCKMANQNPETYQVLVLIKTDVQVNKIPSAFGIDGDAFPVEVRNQEVKYPLSTSSPCRSMSSNASAEFLERFKDTAARKNPKTMKNLSRH